MTWRDEEHLDADTVRLLAISCHFLAQYFGHPTSRADAIMGAFLASDDRNTEDFLHHEGAYRIAAIAHFTIAMQGARSDVADWLHTSGHGNAPKEALAYFRDQYFDRS